MFHPHRSLAVALSLAAGLWLAGHVEAGPKIPLKGKGTGQVTKQVDPTPGNPVGVQEYVVQGNLTFMGKTSAKGTTFFTADGAVEGFFLGIAADGSTGKGAYTGRFAPIPGTPNFRFEILTVWTGQTGRLAGVTGRSKGVAIVNGLTGAFTWSHDGVWMLP
jgi:hypothetical protein